MLISKDRIRYVLFLPLSLLIVYRFIYIFAILYKQINQGLVYEKEIGLGKHFANRNSCRCVLLKSNNDWNVRGNYSAIVKVLSVTNQFFL